MSQAKNWSFTINNYTQDDLERLERLGNMAGNQMNSVVHYLIVGREVGEEGTPHLQCYIQFVKKIRLSQVKAHVGTRAHCEVSIGNASQNQVYCMKENNFHEFGVVTTSGMGLSSRKGAYPLWFWIDI